MSAASKITLGMAVTVSTAIIGYVHYKQSADRLKLHDGVLRDVEQQQRRKHENTYALQQQIDITKQLKAQETSTPDKNLVSEPAPCKCKCCTESLGRPTSLAGCSKQPQQKQHQQARAMESGGEEEATSGAPTRKDEI
ncbi:protein PET117 homolog, mitochondrial [Drosophila serrata]|uniref:protein PET117 homolog, mitochondrial n=1 Tax=Drosophila serrata TaxID=7274 RepID=UPI000A1CFC59|nr:protein PET117 homolog, mitochondrial [Drosophila serrata]